MSPSAKTKTQSAPQWAIGNAKLFPLNDAENAIVNGHDDLWREQAEGAKPFDSFSVEMEWAGIKNGSEYGDEEALKLMKQFATLEHFARYRRAEQLGRARAFDRLNAGTLEVLKPIARRCRERLEKLLSDYSNRGRDTRALLELSPIGSDDCTKRLEGLINDCMKIESRNPGGFEILRNNIELIEIEIE